MKILRSVSKFKVVMFFMIAIAVAHSSLLVAMSRVWTPRELAILFMGVFTSLTGAAFIEEIRRSQKRALDPFGDEAISPEVFAAGFLKNLEPSREEEVIRYLSSEQPEVLDALRSSRVIYDDLNRHDPEVVKEAFAIHRVDSNEFDAVFRRKIVDEVEARYLSRGIHDFTSQLRETSHHL